MTPERIRSQAWALAELENSLEVLAIGLRYLSVEPPKPDEQRVGLGIGMLIEINDVLEEEWALVAKKPEGW